MGIGICNLQIPFSKHTKNILNIAIDVVNLSIPDNSIVFHFLIRIGLTCGHVLLGYPTHRYPPLDIPIMLSI